MIFSRENAIDVMADMVPLIIKHHYEVSRFKDLTLKPNLDLYVKCDEAGILRIFTARDKGDLVGYLICYIRPSLHFQTQDAVQDALYFAPSHRGHTSLKFLKWCEEQIKNEGVDFIYQHVNVDHDFSPILKRWGYEHLDSVYVKRLSSPPTASMP